MTMELQDIKVGLKFRFTKKGKLFEIVRVSDPSVWYKEVTGDTVCRISKIPFLDKFKNGFEIISNDEPKPKSRLLGILQKENRSDYRTDCGLVYLAGTTELSPEQDEWNQEIEMTEDEFIKAVKDGWVREVSFGRLILQKWEMGII